MRSPKRFVAAVALALATTFGSVAVSDVASAAPAAPSARSAVTPGAFCKASDAGKIDYTRNGVKMRCETAPGDSRHRWREVVK